MTSFGTYASLAWQKIQTIQDRLTFRKVSERNQFGLVEDMRAMGDRERLRARTRIREFATGSVKLNPWLMEMSSSLLTLKIPFFIVELPVMRDFRQNVGDTPEAAIFRVRLNESLTSTGTRFFNLSSPPWIEDTYFPDGLHLTRAGAKLFSKDLGALLGKHSTD
jgi:hypothetical protein